MSTTKNEDVQLYLTKLCQEIELPNDAQTWLNEIVQLWVTYKGISHGGNMGGTLQEEGRQQISKIHWKIANLKDTLDHENSQ